MLSVEDGGKRIRLSHTEALRMEEDAETKGYLQESARKGGGFAMTLGEALSLRRSRQK